ncbi:Protein often near L-alanine-DL-glutamate epimerase (cell wall recycling) [Olavius sp. associated proteobacterium Delta 1]|nr:Protein often near L-alanine-DL-glutamate epimerase (cell wall recycling) [Olavius sp. associated proteobacterium Delta 1]
MDTALILTNGRLETDDAKTAHGLIRGTSRFKIVGVIDPVSAGRDAGEVLDGRRRNIPVYASIAEFMEQKHQKPDFGIVGVALSGGKLPEDWHKILLEAIQSCINIISTMHYPLSEILVLREAARKNGVQIMDLRKPKPIDQLHFWNGEIYKVHTPRIAVLGMDCSIGKRTTCRFIEETCRKNGIQAEMIYTGQTGWLQGYRHGFIFDATLNDFVSGELEHAIVECNRQSSPDLILIEGQSGLRNPSGPCGSEIIVSANAKGVILQHAPFRTHYEELERLGCRLPDVADEIKLIKMYGAETLAVSLNGEGGTGEDLIRYRDELTQRLGLPVIRPLQEGVVGLLPVIQHFISQTSE